MHGTHGGGVTPELRVTLTSMEDFWIFAHLFRMTLAIDRRPFSWSIDVNHKSLNVRYAESGTHESRQHLWRKTSKMYTVAL